MSDVSVAFVLIAGLISEFQDSLTDIALLEDDVSTLVIDSIENFFVYSNSFQLQEVVPWVLLNKLRNS